MPTAVGGADDVAAFLIGVYGDDGFALELAAVSLAVLVLIRYAVVPCASGLITSLSGLHAAFAVDAVAAGGDGLGAAGLDGATIAQLPCFVVVRRTGEGDEAASAATTARCAVCLGDVEEGETARALPCCRHAFHARCVDAWLRLRPTCPVCRATFR